MNHSNSRFSWLFYRYQDNSYTPQEREEFLEMAAKEECHEELNHLLGIAIDEAEADRKMDREKADQLYAAILNRSQATKTAQAVVKKLFPWRRIAVAASVILMMGIGFYAVITDSKPMELAQLPKKENHNNKIVPGHDNAILTLADGTSIVLDSAANGALAEQGNIKVIKLDGQIKYAGDKSATAPVYNTISTARGNQYQLILADGSKVWLNAASSIYFPAAFAGDERRVKITGEAYFEVAHNATAPFIVDVNGMEITVLGTHFNVNAYSDEASIKTTLLEGSVKIAKENTIGILKPGQQAILTHNSRLTTDNSVDTDEVVAWKNGSFIFNSENIESIMRQVSRWYDVEINYKGQVSKETFSGIVSRQSSLSQVLKILEAGGVKFKIEGRRIMIL